MITAHYRVSKAVAWQELTWLRENRKACLREGLIDITEEPLFRWERWVANIRKHSDAFVGLGVKAVYVTERRLPLQLWAVRVDGTWACLQLERTPLGKGWDYTVSFFLAWPA